MSLSERQRSQIVLSHEAVVLSQGLEIGADLARATADGSLNALIRLEGAEAAARYALALSDRVCAGLREPTALPEPEPELSPEIAAPSSAVIVPASARRDWTFYGLGFLTGVSVAAIAVAPWVRP